MNRTESKARDDGGALLEVRGLTVTFGTPRGDVDVVRDLSFTVDRRQTLGIVGESGSGKSMTSLAVMGLLPKGATASGSIRLDGVEILGKSDAALRKLRGNSMAMVFQDPLSSLNPYYTVGLQITEAYRAHHNVSRKAARAVAIEALDRVRIKDPHLRIDHYPHQFSGGMRQRIMIAIALCCEPDLVIADEPTTALDVTVQAQILELMADLQAETGTGMIFITHDLAVVSQVAQDVVVMNGGVQVEAGSTEQIFSAPQHDYTRALLAAIPRLDDDLEELKMVGDFRTGATR
ncbi:ABC transporter ATP-binding protein [Specibacter cremeus]|uniref:ABC transporter ATP-binding protein n=1 Tax=Specibacter cremeus TaxID=1629051 RepID=UPI000F76868E|nr:ABC transporter ATP-binding protein [Specibacter cremeus]